MASIHRVRNQYLGINAHLHSYFQAEGGWDGFHTNHIADLTRALRAQLLPMGYTAEIEQSLQIRRYGEPVGSPESDVTVYDMRSRGSASQPLAGDTHLLVMAIPELLGLAEEELSQYRAIGIYRVSTGERGTPVAWLELLSPSNKPGAQDAAYYNDKRLKLLQSGLVFVELDYLHESPPTFERLPNYRFWGAYPQAQPGAHAYRILVVDPRPSFLEGTFFGSQFDVDERVPTVRIPLNGEDVLTFNFDAPYQKTFAEMLYGLQLVDYEQLPLHFERYREPDQTRILCRLLAVRDAVQQGKSLEAEPLPVPNLTYAAAFTQWQQKA